MDIVLSYQSESRKIDKKLTDKKKVVGFNASLYKITLLVITLAKTVRALSHPSTLCFSKSL